MPARLLALISAMVLAGAGCLPYDDASLYSLWAVNTGAEDRLIVLGNDSDGNSTQPPLVIPADGRTRSTFGSTMGSQAGATASILVYDPDCTLLAKVEVRVGSYLLTLDGDQAVLTELARPMQPTGAELAADSPANCAGGAPP
jgi:hypothetical protein